MTAQELIDRLHDIGDDKFLKNAKVRIINDNANTDYDIMDWTEIEVEHPFDVKYGVNTIDIHISPNT